MFYFSSLNNQKIHKKIINFIGVTEDKYILDEIFSNYKIHTVIHLSGVSNDPTALLDPALTEKSNVFATKLLVKIAKKIRLKVYLLPLVVFMDLLVKR